MDYIALMDFYSMETSFGFEGEDNFKTMCGGLISLLIMVICLIVVVTDKSYYLNDIRLVEVVDQTPYPMNGDQFAVGISLINLTSNQKIPL
jgi:hypothetical protein